MKVLKFGGSSIATADKIENVISIIEKEYEEEPHLSVVVSAFGGTTDLLLQLSTQAAARDQSYEDSLLELEQKHIDIARQIIEPSRQAPILGGIKQWLNDLGDVLHGVFLVRELSPRTQDFILSFGERLAAFTISSALSSKGTDAEFVDARKLVRTNYEFGNALVQLETTFSQIKNDCKEPKLRIVTGFIGSTETGETTTIGRGGSDYSASLFAAALDAGEVSIWTDVDGMMTADPRKVPKAFSLSDLTYEEAMELSHFGARVIHPPTLQPALDKNIPIRISNTFNLSFEGTVIAKEPVPNDRLVTGISSIEEISLIRVQGSGMVGVAGVSMRLFGALAQNGISVILITQASSEHTICFAVSPQSSQKARRVIEGEFALEIGAGLIAKPIVENNLSIVSVVGENMRNKPGVASKVFRSLGRNGINVVAIAQGSSELNISVVIEQQGESKALNALHDEFFLSGTRSLNIFIAGHGLIASTLLRQIQENQLRLKQESSIDLRVIALSNSSKIIVNHHGLNLSTVSKELAAAETPGGFDNLASLIKKLNFPNSVFIDCTAEENVADIYQSCLENSVAVVTPNKKVQSGNCARFRQMKNIAKEHQTQWLFETSVGAGLPVISTLKDLTNSGDRIRKIEAVLSGTLSYIFNSFDGSKPFSTVVKEAQERGYTEPDPRDDLNGLDVARKILILAREAGLDLEPSDVEVENLVPEDCRNVDSVEEFFEKLKNWDNSLRQKFEDASSRNSKLCYIAQLDDEKASISLKEVNNEHPFYSLSGSDNIISFTTDRYSDRPLVVKGPGAGAEVTAAGVFADIIRLAHFGNS